MRYTRFVVALLGSLIVYGLGSASAAELEATKATTSRAAREDAVQSIPFDKLSADARTKVGGVLSRTSIYRRLPVQVVECDPELHLFLVRNPDVVVNIWEVMGISKVMVDRTGPTSFRSSDGAGTRGQIEFLYSSHDTHVIYSDGSYEGPLFNRPIRGQCVLVLKTGYIREPNGRHYVTQRLDTFLHLDNVGVELIAKTFQPLVGKSADYNFTETSNFMGNLSRTAEVNPRAVKRLAERLTRVDAETRDEFVTLTTAVSDKAASEDVVASAADAKPKSASRQASTGTQKN